MKKLIALVMALAMLLSFAAAETATVDFTSMLSEADLALGTFVKVSEDLPAAVWIMNDLFTVVPPEEYPEELTTGHECLVLACADSPEDRVVMSVLSNDTGTFDDLVKALNDDPATFSEVEEAVINGIRSVGYKVTEEDGTVLMYATYEVTDYAYLNIVFRQSDNMPYLQAAGLMVASVSLVEEDDSNG